MNVQAARHLDDAAAGESAPSLDVLATLAAERPRVVCNSCHEDIVHVGEWWHVRTGLSAHWRDKDCRPLCRDCEKPGLIAIGADAFVGSGIRFVVDHFACHEHAKGQGPIVRT